MGDQIGNTVSGTLHFVPEHEFKRILKLSVSKLDQCHLFACLCRINILYMIARSGSGHIGSSFSSIDIMSWLHLNELNNSEDDIFFSSKGHDAPALYNVWLGLGKLKFDLLHKLRRIDGLPGHPDLSTPNVVTNTGSLGMGVSKAKGMIFANRLNGISSDIYVLTGDGELQEGQFWESLISAVNHKLHELVVIVDHNKLQSDTLVTKVSDLGELEAKLLGFGWHVSRCDGNNLEDFSKTLSSIKDIMHKPKVIIADTIKGKGVSFMEHTSIDSDVELYTFHSGAPKADQYFKASKELIDRANAKLASFKEFELEISSVEKPIIENIENQQKLIPAYSNALLNQAQINHELVALDADLILDTGLIPFSDKFPDRLIECGIAEQDMVSQAGGMALKGLLPIVHSFACFLSTRPNEQIYNNATEGKKIIYVGSLAGMLPGGPGHSHQAIRDISSLGGIPNLTLMEPSCEEEVRHLLDWSVNVNNASSYIRLVSIPWVVPYELPSFYKPELGKGVVLRDGGDFSIISYGPIMLSIAIDVADKLFSQIGLGVKVINLPWLNNINTDWLNKELQNINTCISIENHFHIGGQGDRIADAISSFSERKIDFHKLAITSIPVCGTNSEVLEAHGLDSESIMNYIKKLIK